MQGREFLLTFQLYKSLEVEAIFPLKGHPQVKKAINDSYVDQNPRSKDIYREGSRIPSNQETSDVIDLLIKLKCPIIELPTAIVEQFTKADVKITVFGPASVRSFMQLNASTYKNQLVSRTDLQTNENVLKLLKFILSDEPQATELVSFNLKTVQISLGWNSTSPSS
jgi:hypothetical protein